MDEQKLIRIAKALADPRRFRILKAIAVSGEVCGGELAEQLPIAQASVSHHLKTCGGRVGSITIGSSARR